MTSAEEPQLRRNPNTDFSTPAQTHITSEEKDPLHTGRSEQGLQGTLSRHHLVEISRECE